MNSAAEPGLSVTCIFESVGFWDKNVNPLVRRKVIHIHPATVRPAGHVVQHISSLAYADLEVAYAALSLCHIFLLSQIRFNQHLIAFGDFEGYLTRFFQNPAFNYPRRKLARRKRAGMLWLGARHISQPAQHYLAIDMPKP